MNLKSVCFGLLIIGCDFRFILVQLGVQFRLLGTWQSQIFLSSSDFFSKWSVFAQQFLDLAFQTVVFLIVGDDSLFVFIQLLNYLHVLVGWQSEIFLHCPDLAFHWSVFSYQLSDFLLKGSNGLVHSFDFTKFSVEIAKFIVLFFEDWIESFDLLWQNGNLTFVFGSLSVCISKFLQSFFKIFVFIADNLEFVCQLSDVTSWESKILLDSSDFLSETGVFR